MVSGGTRAVRATRLAWVEPLDVFRRAGERPDLVWLDSGGEPEPFARFSVLTLSPQEVLEVRVGDGRLASVSANPFASLQRLYDRWRERFAAPSIDRASNPDGPEAGAGLQAGLRGAFTGGVIALVGYDAGRAIERIPSVASDDPALPDLWAGVYDAALVFDRRDRSVALTTWDAGSDAARELLALAGQAAETGTGAPAPPLAGARAADARAGREGFLAGVDRIRREIARGEIYQANLTRRVTTAAPMRDAPALYERLRAASPTPFGAYVDAGAFRVLSASPERFLRIAGGIAETRPIKGTRPRGRDPAEDERLRGELLASAKDAAELLMIVDLERNDLGRVGETGSVTVSEFPAVEGYSSVWHLVATVRARLRAGVTATDVLRAAFPGGSITGAPKLRAMEILEQIEPARRKFSMGSLVAWDFGGDLDSSILIRTVTMRGGEALFDVGAGIVADSSPEAEFVETLAKAAPLIAALEGA